MTDEFKKTVSFFDKLKYFVKKWRLPLASFILISGSITAVVFIVPIAGKVDKQDPYTIKISQKLKEVLHADYKIINSSKNKEDEITKIDYIFQKQVKPQDSKTTSYMNGYENYEINITNKEESAPNYVKVHICKNIDKIDVAIFFGNDKSIIEKKPETNNLKDSIEEIVREIANIKSPNDKAHSNVTTVFTFKGAKDIFMTKESALKCLWDLSSPTKKWLINDLKDADGKPEKEAKDKWVSGDTEIDVRDKWVRHEVNNIRTKEGAGGLSEGESVDLITTVAQGTTPFKYYIYNNKAYHSEDSIKKLIEAQKDNQKPICTELRVYEGKDYLNKEEMEKEYLIINKNYVITS